MPRAWLPRQCAYARCGVTFTPKDGRQRFHSPVCAQEDRISRRSRRCSHCGGVCTGSFCNDACRAAYALTAHRGRPPRDASPVSVLLPLGSSPRSAAINPYMGELPERRIFCRRYERCLAYAESQRWPGFACDKCDVMEPKEPEGWNRPKGSNWE